MVQNQPTVEDIIQCGQPTSGSAKPCFAMSEIADTQYAGVLYGGIVVDSHQTLNNLRTA